MLTPAPHSQSTDSATVNFINIIRERILLHVL